MKTSTAAALALVPALLVLSARPARSELWTDDELARETSACALGRQNRQLATTQSCLSCHDGSVAMAVNYAVGAAVGGGMHASHPVDVDYAAAAARLPGRLQPAGSLPANLVLPGGKVTCVTCHDGASSEKAHASMPLARSRLCMGCHDL